MAKHDRTADPRPQESGKIRPSQETTAEQVRESAESARAQETEASIRDRMVDIGRGNQQAGRQKG